MRKRCSRLFALQILFLIFVCIRTDSNSTSYEEQMKQTKEKLLKMIKKETHKLSGFDEFAIIPVNYPLDICLMEIDKTLYAICLNIERTDRGNSTMLKVLKKVPTNPRNPLQDYDLIFEYKTNAARAMDCVSMGTEGYIAVVNDLKSSKYSNIAEGSPVFQLKNDQIIPMQYFTTPYQSHVHLVKNHGMLFMVQTFDNFGTLASDARSQCPIFRWDDSTFNVVDILPCLNAVRIESFKIENDIYVGVANHMDEHGNRETYSTIYQYNMDTHTFNLTQKLKTFGAIDLKHFHINDGIVNEHYLIVANTVDNGADSASNAIIYHFNQGHFTPMQVLNFETEIKQFLPFVTESKEFVLVISNKNAPTKTYQFDGWKFVETTIQFTGGSFGTGVSKMRTHKLNDKFLVIVVANSHMYRDTPNLFRVKFQIELDYDFVKAFNLFDSWYEAAKKKIKTDRLLEIYHQMEKLELPQNFGTLNLEDTNVNILRADWLSSTSILINFTDVNRTLNKTNELLSKESSRRPKRLNESTQSNATHVENNLLEQKTDPLSVDGLTVSGRVTVAKINGHHIDDLLRTESDLHLKNLVITYLLVPKDLNMTVTTSKRIKRDAAVEDEIMNLNDVVVDGLVNRFNFSSLIENALRIDQPEQHLTSDVKFQSISANTINVKDNKISDFNLNRIASIKDNETLINEPLIFAQLLSTNELNIAERLNHLTVQNGKLNVLLKKSKRIQTITGDKEFDAVNLLEPIILHGRINISSPMMNKIKPIVTVDEELIINENIVISGNVTIKRILEASNIVGQSIRFSLLQVLGDAIRINEVDIDVPLEFSQPIFTEDIRSPTRLNGIPLESFIQRNVTGVQRISARKTIISDLSIENGVCNANEINGVNLQVLNTTMLKRTAKNQAITGTIQIKQITAEHINSNAMSFGKTQMDRILTKNTNQTINGNVVIHGNVFISNGSTLQAEHLTTEKNVFGLDLNEILDDSYNYSNDSVKLTSSKWFQNVAIGELIIESDFWKVASTDAIVKRLDALSRGLLFNQTVDYDNQFTIDRLYVTGTINKIPSESFGIEWLLSEGDQTFLAPQRFTNFTATENVQLDGRLNGNQLQHLVSETIWRNSQEQVFLEHPIFENITFEKSLNIDGQFAGMLFPDDLILSHSNLLQNFAETIIFSSPVNVLGTLSVSDTLNGFNFPQMCDLIEPIRDTNYGLEIKGGVQFLTDPIIKNLNSEPFERIIATTWFTDNPSVNFSDSVKFGDVIFHKPITATSLVNGISLESISERYLSLTKPQKISSSIYFRNTVHFRNTLQTNSISLKGQLRQHESDIHFDISHFDANVLKNVPGAQLISAPWTVREFNFLGNLYSVTVNNLNLKDDVVRWDRADKNIIRAEKSFKSLNINQLSCHAGCSVQGVDIDEWISKGVLLNMNYTIQGTVFINDAAFSFIEALMRVNNDPFNSLKILLKHSDQRIDHIVTIGPNANPYNVTPLTFNEINVNYINGQNFTAFIQNRVTRGPANEINANILSNLQFLESVTFDNLYTSGRLLSSTHVDSQKFRSISDELDEMAQPEDFKHFNRIVTRAALPTDTVQHLSQISSHTEFADFVSWNGKNVQFHKWNRTMNTLDLNNDESLPLPQNVFFFDLTSIRPNDLFSVQFRNKVDNKYTLELYHHSILNRPVHSIKQIRPIQVRPFDWNNRPCLISHPMDEKAFMVICMETQANATNSLEIHPIDSQKMNGTNKIRWISGYENTVVSWLVNDEIEIRWFDTHTNRTAFNRKQFVNITSVDVKGFQNENGSIVICANKYSIGHKGITTKGVINIYSVMRERLSFKQSIEIPSETVVQCGFSQFSNKEPILVVATNSFTGDNIYLYQHLGILGHQLLETHQIDLFGPPIAETSESIRFKLSVDQNRSLEFVIVTRNNHTIMFECLYKKLSN